jgi:predicted amidohydrolase YtcJ
VLRVFLFIFSIYAPVLLAATQCIEADLILHEGTIFTGNSEDSFVGSIASKDSNITYVGSSLSNSDLACSGAEVINLKGNYVFPGFVDAHAHLKGIGYRELTLNLQGISSLDDTLKVVRNYLSKKNPGDWVIGRGWIDKLWPEKRFPNKYDLDAFSPDNPIVLERADGHAVVVNSLVLKLAKIDKNTKDPQGGFYRKRSKWRANWIAC